MQTDQTLSDSSEIINLAINIFQNVGIKRWIDHIQILKKQQIYFEICKIIFPNTIIDLFRLSQNNTLTAGQKIQGVIDLIAKLIRNDLYHISGQAIAQGKTNHLKNFLQLLEALSETITHHKYGFQVHSAPPNQKSVQYDDEHSYYTVIGMDKEFKQNIYYSEDGSGRNPMSQHSSADDSSSTHAPMPPKNQVYQTGTHLPKEPLKETQLPGKTPHYSPHPKRQRKKKRQPYPQQADKPQEQTDNQWVGMVKTMNDTKLQIQSKQMQDQQGKFAQWKRKAKQEQRAEVSKIESKSNRQKQLINDHLKQRDQVLLCLEGQDQAIRSIGKLFRQEKEVKRMTEMKARRREEEKAEQLMDFSELNGLLEQAYNYRPQAVRGG